MIDRISLESSRKFFLAKLMWPEVCNGKLIFVYICNLLPLELYVFKWA